MSSRGSQTPQRRKLHAWVDEIGLDDDDRMQLASYMLRRDITSWSQLDEAQVARLLDACEGFHLISELLSQRVP